MTFILFSYNVWFFFIRKNTNNSRTNTDDAPLPTSSIDIPISKNFQIKNCGPP